MGNHGSTCHYNTQIITITENFNKIKSTWLRAKAVMMSCSLWMIFIGSFIFMLFSESACVLVSCCDNSKLNTYIYVIYVLIVHIKNLLLISHFNFFLNTYHYSNCYIVIDNWYNRFFFFFFTNYCYYITSIQHIQHKTWLWLAELQNVHALYTSDWLTYMHDLLLIGWFSS